MSEYKIYHNPRCSKSRQALEILTNKGVSLDIIEYLKTPPSADEVEEIISYLDVPCEQLIRQKEEEYKNVSVDIKDPKNVSQILAAHPKLLERPIVVHGTKAVIARPPEKVQDLF